MVVGVNSSERHSGIRAGIESRRARRFRRRLIRDPEGDLVLVEIPTLRLARDWMSSVSTVGVGEICRAAHGLLFRRAVLYAVVRGKVRARHLLLSATVPATALARAGLYPRAESSCVHVKAVARDAILYNWQRLRTSVEGLPSVK